MMREHRVSLDLGVVPTLREVDRLHTEVEENGGAFINTCGLAWQEETGVVTADIWLDAESDSDAREKAVQLLRGASCPAIQR